jgi:hypothetical protein
MTVSNHFEMIVEFNKLIMHANRFVALIYQQQIRSIFRDCLQTHFVRIGYNLFPLGGFFRPTQAYQSLLRPPENPITKKFLLSLAKAVCRQSPSLFFLVDFSKCPFRETAKITLKSTIANSKRKWQTQI